MIGCITNLLDMSLSKLLRSSEGQGSMLQSLGSQGAGHLTIVQHHT